MKKKILILMVGFLLIAVITGFLLWVGISEALTLDGAIADVEKQVTEKGLTPKDRFMAVSTIERLVEKGVSVEHAYQLVDASISHGIRAKELAPITRSIELVTSGASEAAATVATTAITNNYTSWEVMKVVGAVDTIVKDGAKSNMAEDVVRMGVDRGLPGDVIQKIAKSFGEDIKKGIFPEEAIEHATRYADEIGSGMGSER